MEKGRGADKPGGWRDRVGFRESERREGRRDSTADSVRWGGRGGRTDRSLTYLRQKTTATGSSVVFSRQGRSISVVLLHHNGTGI